MEGGPSARARMPGHTKLRVPNRELQTSLREHPLRRLHTWFHIPGSKCRVPDVLVQVPGPYAETGRKTPEGHSPPEIAREAYSGTARTCPQLTHQHRPPVPRTCRDTRCSPYRGGGFSSKWGPPRLQFLENNSASSFLEITKCFVGSLKIPA